MGGRAGEKGRMSEEFELPPEIIREIVRAVGAVKYGTVTIIIQDSRVVQIDKTEKVRLC
ncbi:YezD family protein [Calderihabitans maritimus]|uniref:YezD family protein n=1 Tax=Calderihabitans maritimus TaxID=1246530 RepID=UPI00192D1CF5|nr:YezD family protein [Calderihabitans maritimus]